MSDYLSPAETVEAVENLRNLNVVVVYTFRGVEYDGSTWTYFDRVPDGKQWSMGSDWHWHGSAVSHTSYHIENLTKTYIHIPLMASGDYSSGGRAVQESNLRYFLETYNEDSSPGIHVLYGDHSSRGLAIRLDCLTEDMLDALHGLSDYPLLCDQALYEYEVEAQAEAWADWVHCDFVRDIETELSLNLDDSDENAGNLCQVFTEAMERAGEYWFEDGCDQYCHVDNIAAQVDRELLDEHGVVYSEK